MQSEQTSPLPSALPYHDTKPQGAADFYFAINATFRYIIDKFGPEGWIAYLRDLATDYYRPVWSAWKIGGLDAIARYLDESFRAEPGAVFEIDRQADSVTLLMHECPAIKHLKSSGREVMRDYCRHCYYQGGKMAELAGYSLQVKGGNGSCRQTFSAQRLSQDLNDILPVS